MDELRYWIACALLIGLPPGLLFWLCIHPFAGFWRKRGPGWTYGLVGAGLSLLGGGLFAVRSVLLATEYGTNAVCLGLAGVCLGGAGALVHQHRKHLTLRILVGLPEISPQRHPARLLQEGIYARIRHPRYVEVFLSLLGFALVANYPVVYVWTTLSLPLLYMIVVFEERELHRRFGSAYAEYCRRVPRFVPRRRAERAGG